MKIKKKSPQLSTWVRWPAEEKIHRPGVYVFAHLDKAPPGPADHTSENIVYIGETSRTLHVRWLAFNRSANRGKRSHSGGRSYNAQFGKPLPTLHVAWLHIDEPNTSLLKIKIKYWERRLLLEFAEARVLEGAGQRSLLPLCNRH